jgi:NhaA family Na+:H+ antiporter
MAESGVLVDPVGPADHGLGPAGAAVTLVEYGDYESPACGRAFVELERLRDRFDRDLALVYRHFPLVDQHPQAMAAALASEAAADAGQFWTMHELLYDRQDRLGDSDLAEYAARLGLADAGAIGSGGRDHVAQVEKHMAGARAAGITDVPVVFINGERYGGAIELDALSTAVSTAGARPTS